MNFDDDAEIQDKTPVQWIDKLGDGLELHSNMNPNLAVSVNRDRLDRQLGEPAAGTMAG